MLGGILKSEKPKIGSDAVLVLDLSIAFPEQQKDNPLSSLSGDASYNVPGLYDVVRMLHYAKSDSSVKGLYIKGGSSANGFAASEELRNAITDFKKSKKFVIAYGDVLDQRSYYVSTVADKIYCNPSGGVDWDGFGVTLLFMKGLLDKLGIEPQVFYAGKFKSATEPFRVTKMTEPNKIQTTEMLSDLYANFLLAASKARDIDTGKLHWLSNTGAVRTATDALQYNLVDGLKYDGEVKDIMLKKLHQQNYENINFVSFGTYAKAVSFNKDFGNDKIAIIYASGDIVEGKGDDGDIGSTEFINIIRDVKNDDDIKAVVFRVNSPGGSSLASDAIWYEISETRKIKPVVVSMGDYAASGGYYISCSADSVFANEGTITGSIGVFSILPNMQPFFNNKLGITFDGVKTAPYADMGSATRPLSETEKRFMQASVDSIYYTFKHRVSDGRKKDMAYIDSIAQGHVYTGNRGLALGLVDKIGTLQDAVDCAARMANSFSYRTKEYPEKKTFWEQLIDRQSFSANEKAKLIQEEIGEEQYRILQQAKKLQTLVKSPQAKLPFDFIFK